MGFWAKDGAYMHDDDDIKALEAMNETQGQAYDRLHRHNGASEPLFTPEEEARREAAYAQRVENRIKAREGQRAYEKQQAEYKEQEKQRELKKEAYKAAKQRFGLLSPVKRLFLNLAGKGINSHNAYESVETLDSLYRGKSR